jgi:hypothetical protein
VSIGHFQMKERDIKKEKREHGKREKEKKNLKKGR